MKRESFSPLQAQQLAESFANGAPFYQQIALGDISYSVVPEANATSLAFAVCCLAALVRNRKR